MALDDNCGVRVALPCTWTGVTHALGMSQLISSSQLLVSGHWCQSVRDIFAKFGYFALASVSWWHNPAVAVLQAAAAGSGLRLAGSWRMKLL